jgi:hypothetical protein
MIDASVVVVGVRGMTLLPSALRGIAVKSHLVVDELADLHQLSGVTAFSVIGLCLSLIALNFVDAGQWLIAVANGF